VAPDVVRQGAALACGAAALYFGAWCVGYLLVGPVADGAGGPHRRVALALGMMAAAGIGEAMALLRTSLPPWARTAIEIAAFAMLALGTALLMLALNTISLTCT
jgi:hypothetical protein